MKPLVQSQAPVHLAGMVCAICFLCLSIMSSEYGDLNLSPFLISMVVSLFALVALYSWHLIYSISISIGNIIFWAIILRIIGLFTYPILEDDIFRYMWDGYQTISTGSPYAYAPSYFFSFENLNTKLDDILGLINHPDISTIYGPVTQYCFALAALVAVGEVWPLQVIMTVFDAMVIYVLLKKARPIYVLLYAWSPLVIKETVITAHPDIIAIALIFLACAVARKYIFWAAALSALAVSAKIFAILLVPFILLFNVRAWLLFIVVFVATFIPFIQSFHELENAFSSMGGAWLFNSPIYYFYASMFGFAHLVYLKGILAILFIVVWLCIFYRFYCEKFTCKFNGRPFVFPRGDIIFMVFLLAMPVANPWYFLWILPFAAVYPSVWAWTASGAVFLSYFIGLNMPGADLDNYQQPVWAITVEYFLILVGFIIDRLIVSRRLHR